MLCGNAAFWGLRTCCCSWETSEHAADGDHVVDQLCIGLAHQHDTVGIVLDINTEACSAQVIRSTEKIAEDFLKEISVLKECRSPHIVMVRPAPQLCVASSLFVLQQ